MTGIYAFSLVILWVTSSHNINSSQKWNVGKLLLVGDKKWARIGGKVPIFYWIFFVFYRKSLRKVHTTRIAYTINWDGFMLLFAKPFPTPWRKRLSCLVLQTTLPTFTELILFTVSILIGVHRTCSIKSRAISAKMPNILLSSYYVITRKM